MEDQTKRLLKDKKLRQTPARKEILKVFLGKHVAHSHAELELKLNNRFDRVTIYRTLDTFLKKGIIHKIPSGDGASLFALCVGCNEHEHHDNHVHFKCTQCGTSECLIDQSVPEISLPEGYKMADANLLIEGTCRNCA